MNFLIHSNFPSHLIKQWDDLLNRSICDYPFLKYGYLENWWLTRGGGEWTNNAQLAIVSAHEGDHLVGIAPFFLNPEKEKAVLYLLGSKEICDYLDFIVKPADLESFIHNLSIFITSPAFPRWDRMILNNLIQSSPTVAAMERNSRQLGWHFSTDGLKKAPAISLPGNWEDYLNSIDKKQRHEIRRKMRRAEENTDLAWYFSKDPISIDKEINDFLELMALDQEKSAFLTNPMREQMRLTLGWAFKERILQLSFLEIQHLKSASYFCFHYKNNLLVYNSGFDPKFSEYSPGWVLLGNLLRWANENQIAVFDFMRGEEDYKYRFGAKDRFITSLKIERQES
jgi:CelD/BcsL family acetyltransferase involved in cellulose biosynthesis